MVTPALHGDRSGIENEGKIGVAKHGCAGVEPDVLEHSGERLDDDFFRIGERVHDQAEAAAVRIEHGDKVVAVRSQLAFPLRHQQTVEKDQRKQLAAQAVEWRVLNPLDGPGSQLGRKVHQLGQRAPGAARSFG